MSKEKKVTEGILVFAFVEEGAADDALETMKKAKKDKTVDFWDAVVIRRDAKGQHFYNETKDSSTPLGAGIGALIGGVIGIPGGPAGIVVGAGLGASLGAFAASGDAGLKNENLEKIGHALRAGNSALLIVSSHEYLRNIQEYAGEEDATVALQKLTTGIAEHMVRDQNAAYIITAAGRSVSCHGLEAGDKIAELLGIGTAAE